MIGLPTSAPSRPAPAGPGADTPCVESRTLSQLAGCQVFLKFENLQFTASFKERGACNKLVQLSRGGEASAAWSP
jgi:threonine dehydratase